MSVRQTYFVYADSGLRSKLMKIVNRFLVHRMSSRLVQGQERRRSSAGRDCPMPIRIQRSSASSQ